MTPVHLDRYIYAILRYRWPVVALAVLIMLVTGVGALFITVTNNYRIMFGEDNPQLAAFKALENTFSTSNMAIIAIAPRKGSVFTREALRAIEELTECRLARRRHSRLGRLPYELYTHSRAQGDELIVEPLVDDARSLTDADLGESGKSRWAPQKSPGASSPATDEWELWPSLSSCLRTSTPPCSR